MINVKRLREDARLPVRAHRTDAGADLFSVEEVKLWPGGRAVVATGIAIEIPEGYVGLVHPRSGLAAKHEITVTNAPGTIDSDYRGEVMVLLSRLGTYGRPVTLEKGSRIAQLVIQKVELPGFVDVDGLVDTVRGAAGFGSTGT